MFRRTMIGPLLGAVLVAAGLFVVSGTPGLGLPTASSTPTQQLRGTGPQLGSAGLRRGGCRDASVERDRLDAGERAQPDARPDRLTLVGRIADRRGRAATRLQSSLEKFAKANRLPGTSVTITWADGRTWTGTTGLADVRAARPVTPDTVFAIASMSKTFTSALILGMVDEGRLSLDSKVATILPTVRLGTPGVPIRPVSPSGCCSITPAASPTSSSPRGSTRRCWPVGGSPGRRRCRSRTWASHWASPDGRGITRTPTMSSSGWSPRRSVGRPSPSSSATRLLDPLRLTASSSRAPSGPRSAWPLATTTRASARRPARSAWPMRAGSSSRSRRWSPRPGLPGTSPRPRPVWLPGPGRCTAAAVLDPGRSPGRRRCQGDRTLPAVRCLWPRGPGHPDRRPPGVRSQRPVHRRAGRAALPARTRSRDRRPHQSERRGPAAARRGWYRWPCRSRRHRPRRAHRRPRSRPGRRAPASLLASWRGAPWNGSGSACDARGGRVRRCSIRRPGQSRGSAAPGSSGPARSPRPRGTGSPSSAAAGRRAGARPRRCRRARWRRRSRRPGPVRPIRWM